MSRPQKCTWRFWNVSTKIAQIKIIEDKCFEVNYSSSIFRLNHPVEPEIFFLKSQFLFNIEKKVNLIVISVKNLNLVSERPVFDFRSEKRRSWTKYKLIEKRLHHSITVLKNGFVFKN